MIGQLPRNLNSKLHHLWKWFIEPHHRWFILAQAVFTCLAVYWNHHLPPAGYAVAFIGVQAALMSIHGEMRRSHKAAWMLIIGTFLLIEIRAIRHDRDGVDKKQAEERERSEANFREIASGIKDSINESDRNFNATMAQTENVLDKTQAVSVIAENSLKDITGGDSYAYVSPQNDGSDDFPGVVWNNGEQPLTGVTLTIAHTSEPPQIWGQQFFQPIFIGTVAPHEHAPIPNFLFHPEPDKWGQDNYWVMLSAQNGTVSQSIFFRKDHNHPNSWAYAFQVSRQTVSGKPQAHNLLKEHFVPPKPRMVINKVLLVRDWSDDLENATKRHAKLPAQR